MFDEWAISSPSLHQFVGETTSIAITEHMYSLSTYIQHSLMLFDILIWEFAHILEFLPMDWWNCFIWVQIRLKYVIKLLCFNFANGSRLPCEWYALTYVEMYLLRHNDEIHSQVIYCDLFDTTDYLL